MLIQHRWLSWLILGLLCLIIYALSTENITALDYNRELIIDGELWRLITGNFNHTNIYHVLLNVCALAVISGLHYRYYSATVYLSLILLLSIGVGAGIFLLSPSTHLYVGLSGILHGIIIVGAIIDVTKKYYSGYILIAGTIIKIINEQFFNSPIEMSKLIQAQVLTEAHLYGLVTGLIIAPLFVYLNKKKSA
ncbi:MULTISPECIES: rhombosortase [unclassified Moritella]|uniref:rhombosortase n=1 Tax=unclassified Moritella TaxID=2637987 RepID=UPI001BA6401A|nr:MULTISPECIES: rhombosortase [unclassified Moritella]QUM84728.1 rhombosortase [Moritella sp. 28]QUM88975.1 rhombosortase [Moritella sp. 36]